MSDEELDSKVIQSQVDELLAKIFPESQSESEPKDESEVDEDE